MLNTIMFWVINLLAVALMVYGLYVARKWSAAADYITRELQRLKDEEDNYYD